MQLCGGAQIFMGAATIMPEVEAGGAQILKGKLITPEVEASNTTENGTAKIQTSVPLDKQQSSLAGKQLDDRRAASNYTSSDQTQTTPQPVGGTLIVTGKTSGAFEKAKPQLFPSRADGEETAKETKSARKRSSEVALPTTTKMLDVAQR